MRLTAADYGPAPAPRAGHAVDWWLTDGEGIVAGWVLVFAVCNGLRGAYCWLRDRDERRTVEQLMAGNLPRCRPRSCSTGWPERPRPPSACSSTTAW